MITHVNFHLLVHTIIHNQAVRQPDAMGFHWMARHIGEVSDVRIIEISDLLGRRSSQGDAITVPNVNRGCVRHC